MASNNAFTLQGATPQTTKPTNSLSISGASNPYAKAMGYAGQTNTSSPAISVKGNPASFDMKTATYTSPTSNTLTSSTPNLSLPTPGLIAPGNQDVKSHTTPDGTVQTYYPSGTASKGETTTQNTKTQNDSPATSTTAPQVGSVEYDNANGLQLGTSSQAGYKTPSQTTYPGLVNTLANQQGSPYNTSAQTAIQNINSTAASNDDLGKKAQQISEAAGQRYADIGGQAAKGEAGYLTTGTSPIAQGNAAVIAQTAAAQQQAVAQGAQTALQGNAQALTAKGQEQSGYNSAASQSLAGQGQSQAAIGAAAGYAAPTPNTAYYGDPTSGGVYGQGEQLMNNSVQNALQLIKNGARTDDPNVQALLSPYGAAGAAALNQALLQGNSGYNPTTQNATAGQNANQAVQYQQKATDLDTSLKNLDNVSSTAVNFLNSAGFLNPTSNPHYNEGISGYIANIKNPAAAATYATVIGDLNNFKSQILAQNTGQTPTALTNYVEATDPSKLSAPQLANYLNAVKTLGQQQLSVYQTQSKNSGGGGYAGAPANANTNLPVSPDANLNINSTQAGQSAIGTGINIAGGISGILSGLAGKAAALFK